MPRTRTRIEVIEDLKRVNDEISNVTTIRDNLGPWTSSNEWRSEKRGCEEDLQTLDERRAKLERELSLLPPEENQPDEGAPLV